MAKKINYNLLRILHALLSSESSSLAAEKLNISQPAVSKHLNNLREHFRDPLIVRFNGSNKLTTKAKKLKAQVAVALSQVNSVFSIDDYFHPLQSDVHINIATNSTSIRLKFAQIIKKIHLRAPNISFSFIPICEQIDYKISMGEVDLFIGSHNLINVDVPVDSEILYKSAVKCILSNKHPLSISKNHKLTRRNLEDYPHVIDKSGFSSTANAEAYFKKLQISPKKIFSVMERGAALSILNETNAIFLAPVFFDGRILNKMGLIQMDLPEPVPESKYIIGWPSYWNNNMTHRWVREHFLADQS